MSIAVIMRNLWMWPGRKLNAAEQAFSQRLFPEPADVACDHGKQFIGCLLVLAALAAGMFLPNRAFPLFEPDEGRRAEISREMLVNNDWVVSTLNQQPYYDKPPLFHWLVALSFCCFGTNEAAARLVPALAAILTILATYVFGRRLIGNRAAFLGALALALMAGYSLSGRLLGMDSTLTLFVTMSLLTAHEAVRTSPLRWRWWLTSSVFCGLGVMTKGPIAVVLVLPPLWLFARLSAGTYRPKLGHLAAFGAVAAAIVAPWVVLVLPRDPQVLWEFLVEHNLRRFTEGIAHEEDWWYYLPILAAACLPWSMLFPFFLWQLFQPVFGHRRLQGPNAGRHKPIVTVSRPLGFLLLAACWCVLFFTLSRGKLPLYIMPALPAFALLTGWFLEQMLLMAGTSTGAVRYGTSCAEQSPLLSWCVFGLVPRLTLMILGGAWVAACYLSINRGLTDGDSLVLVAVAITAAMGASLLPRARRSPWAAWALCLVVALGLEMDCGHRLMVALARSRSPLAASHDLREIARSGQAALACPGQMWASMAFACRGDMLDTETASPEQLLSFLYDHPCAFVILSKAKHECLLRLAPAGFRFTTLQESFTGAVILAEQGAACAARP